MEPPRKTYDVVIIGSGPNGLAAGILMCQYGLSVLIIEGQKTVGGGLRSEELTLPGYMHDVCSAIHPLAVSSPFLQQLPLQDYGLKYLYPEINAAHPFDSGHAALLKTKITETASVLGIDELSYKQLMEPIVAAWPLIATDVLGPLHMPHHMLQFTRFGLKALMRATKLATLFKTAGTQGMIAGMAAHAMQPLENRATAAIALVLLASGHTKGWPLPQGGAQQIAQALAQYFTTLGGVIETGIYITSMQQLPSAHAVLFDTSVPQLLQIAGHKFSTIYKWQLERYRYGMGIFKIDWALAAPIPFAARECRHAGTVHIGNTLAEIAHAERQTWQGAHPENPFVLLAQPTITDKTRAPQGRHTAWAYCHVPNSSEKDMTAAIEKQVERFAPGFKDTILARHTMNSRQMQEYNPNYVGGDINNGIIDIKQLFTRPALRHSPYRTSAKGLYLCSAATPPGGGVHGMCGYHAARRALKDIFSISIPWPGTT